MCFTVTSSCVPFCAPLEYRYVTCSFTCAVSFLVRGWSGFFPRVKAKVTLEQATKDQRGSWCIALLFLQPRRYMEVGGQRHAPAALPPRKTRYPLYRRLGGPQVRSERVRKISPAPGFDPRTVQPVANRYTVWAIPAHFVKCKLVVVSCFALQLSVLLYFAAGSKIISFYPEE